MAGTKGENVDVRHNGHYCNVENYSPIEIIHAYEKAGKCLSFEAANALKYILRYKYKGEPVKDLEKAVYYLQIEIEKIKKAP